MKNITISLDVLVLVLESDKVMPQHIVAYYILHYTPSPDMIRIWNSIQASFSIVLSLF